jgi:hypothetical protein
MACYPHRLNPDEYTGRTQKVLAMMLEKEYTSNNIAEVNTAFDGLYERFDIVASESPLGEGDKNARYILYTIHIVAKLWADLWARRGEEIFDEKLYYYYRKARFERSNAHDQLLYDALLTRSSGPKIPKIDSTNK